MMDTLKCPKCGSTTIAVDDCYDTIHGENNTFKELMCGYCEDCGIDLQWEKVYIYKFVGYDEIEVS